MPITLTSGLSTVCNIDITPPTAPTIARAVVIPELPHQDMIALFCVNICKIDSSQQLRRLVIPLEHSNDPSVPTPSVAAWPPTISDTDRNNCNEPQLVNIGAISNGEESSAQLKVDSVFQRRMAEYGSSEEEMNVTQMHGVGKASWFGEPSGSSWTCYLSEYWPR